MNKYVKLVEQALNESKKFVFKFGNATERKEVSKLLDKDKLSRVVTIVTKNGKGAGSAEMNVEHKKDFQDLILSLNEETLNEGKKTAETVLQDVIHQVKTFDKPKTKKLEAVLVINKMKEKRNKLKGAKKAEYQEVIDRLEKEYENE